MIVAKFGGTSVATAEAIRRLVRIVSARPDVRVVVVSALAGVTDALVAVADAAESGRVEEARSRAAAIWQRHRELVAELGLAADVAPDLERTAHEMSRWVATLPRTPAAKMACRDEVLATGELLSSRVVAAAFRAAGTDAAWVDARLVIVTDNDHTRALPEMPATRERLHARVRPHLASGRLAVVGGFVGADHRGATTTLGRGGSDYSAAIVGAALEASAIDIWTDVDGMLTADPRIVPDGRVVPELSFAEASELAYFGAKVLHPSTILPAMAQGIPVRILNSRRPDGAGTRITARAAPGPGPLRALACKRAITVVHITSTRMLMAHGFLRRVFEVFDRHRTVVDVVTTSEVSVSVTVDDARALDAIVADLQPFADVTTEGGLALVCAVGEQLRERHHLCAEVLDGLGGLPVAMVSQSASRQNLTIVVAEADLPAAMSRLHARFFGQAARGGTAGAGPDPAVGRCA
jgi:aspartate kinase